MNTKDLLEHLFELEKQLSTTNDSIDVTLDTFNNRWLRSRLSEIQCNLSAIKKKVEELQEVYTF